MLEQKIAELEARVQALEAKINSRGEAKTITGKVYTAYKGKKPGVFNLYLVVDKDTRHRCRLVTKGNQFLLNLFLNGTQDGEAIKYNPPIELTGKLVWVDGGNVPFLNDVTINNKPEEL